MSEALQKPPARWGGARSNSGGARPNCGGPQPGSGRPRKPAIVEPPEPAPAPQWCVLQTWGQAEEGVAREIARRGNDTYCPLTAVRVPDRAVPTRMHVVNVPMIRSYVFVLLRPGDFWTWMMDEVRGARDFLRNARNKPAALPSGWVEKCQSEDEERLHLRDPGLPPDQFAARAYRAGTRVRVEVGTYSDLWGTVVRCDGMHTEIEMHILGRAVTVTRAWDKVRAA